MNTSEKNPKNKNKGIHPSLQQRFVFTCARMYAALSLRLLYGFRCAPVDVKEPFILVGNHTTDRDLLFSLVPVRKYMYFVLSEHLQRRSRLMDWVVKRFGLVTVFKGSVAGSSVRNILRLVRDGNNVCLFPEGGHSLDGRTNPFSASTGKMVKSARCALITYCIHGGYFLKPRWAKKWRRGPVTTEGAKVYSSQQLAGMTPEEINEIIRRDIAVDAYEEQKSVCAAYAGEDLASGIENIFFLCPVCGAVETIQAEGNSFRCSGCGARGTIDACGYLHGDFPYRTVAEWSDWEKEEIGRRFETGDICSTASNVRLLEILPDHREKTLLRGPLLADSEGITMIRRLAVIREKMRIFRRGRAGFSRALTGTLSGASAGRRLSGKKTGRRRNKYRFAYTDLDAVEYIDQCNTLLFSCGGHFYSLEAAYLDGVLIRRLYILRSAKEAALSGKKFDEAK